MKTDGASRTPVTRTPVLGIPVDCLTMDEAIDRLEDMIEARTPSLVFTADASGLVMAQDDLLFHEILEQAALITPDSSGVVWAMKRAGCANQQRVSGVDLVDRLCARSADVGYRIFFLGAEPGVAELAAERMRLRHPGCNIVGARHGYFPAADDDVVAQDIAKTHPDVLFVAMGMPRQEQFILKTQSIIQAPVAMGVGGSFDVFSGKTKRAPKLIQKMKMEWFWRLILNPKKMSKVKYLPRFVRLVLTSQ